MVVKVVSEKGMKVRLIWKWGLWLLLSYTLVGAGEYPLPDSQDDLVGENYIVEVKKGDSLTRIRQLHDVSYDELLEANPKIDFYKLKIGQRVTIPKQFILPKFREGIVVNIPELRMYYFDAEGKQIHTFTVGLGREEWRTPLGMAKVIKKKEDPVWTVPESIREYIYQETGERLPRVVAPGPDNPMGKYALYLNLAGNYHIHGTNTPTSVGAFISSGCIRLLKEPIEFLYKNVRIGTPVRIIHHPYKVGWLKGKLYLEAHKPVGDYSEERKTAGLSESNLSAVIQEALQQKPAAVVNWEKAFECAKVPSGVPKVIGYE